MLGKYNVAMLVFVDESGDAGMKLAGASSDLFIVTAVLFEDHDEANRCDESIGALRTELGLKQGFEFHFYKCTKRIRARFLESVAGFGFFYLAAVVEKARLRNPAFQDKESLTKYACELVFEDAKPYLENAIVVIDANGARDFRFRLAYYLRKWISGDAGRGLIKKIRTARSEGNNLIQLADMVSGAVWRAFKHQDGSYRRLVSARELKIEVWPK